MEIFGIACFVAMPISVVLAMVNIIRTKALQKEAKRLGKLFYIGVIPFIAFAVMVFVFDDMFKSFLMFFLMYVWGMTFTCIIEVMNHKNKRR